MLAYRGDLSVVELVQVYIYPTPRLLIVVTHQLDLFQPAHLLFCKRADDESRAQKRANDDDDDDGGDDIGVYRPSHTLPNSLLHSRFKQDDLINAMSAKNTGRAQSSTAVRR